MPNSLAQLTTSQICQAIGRKAIASAVNVGVTQVGNAVAENRFPARWFLAVKQLCDSKGVECPAYLFNFVIADQPSKNNTVCPFTPRHQEHLS